ncbi:MAG TPA: hypothetical protein VM509_08305 [Planctomycetota bacterium]|nr:hypothetical protein [Planctomycetota bacterium]
MNRSHAGAGLFELVARVLFLTLSCASAFAQTGKDGASNQAEEKFKSTDPYTKGNPEILKQAGYVSLAPFTFADGIQPIDMVEVLGGIDLLWAETAHFKICSSLKTYKSKADQLENDAIDKDIALLTKKIPACRNSRGSTVDPWLRLHIYALRLERLYGDFCEHTGFSDADFAPGGSKKGMGSGPYLGQKQKFTVLLAEKSSTLGRFTRQYVKKEETHVQRSELSGGTVFLGISAESLREGGVELDSALHCAIAASQISNLLSGLRDNGWVVPLWLEIGMGHWFSRRIDERFTYYADGTSRNGSDDKYIWKPRVRALVENKFPYSWDDMLATLEWSKFTPHAHILSWSRIDWMMQQGPPAMRKFLEPLTARLSVESDVERAKAQLERAKAGLQAGFGKTPEECEVAWRAWVKKTYDR